MRLWGYLALAALTVSFAYGSSLEQQENLENYVAEAEIIIKELLTHDLCNLKTVDRKALSNLVNLSISNISKIDPKKPILVPLGTAKRRLDDFNSLLSRDEMLSSSLLPVSLMKKQTLL